ncbi:unnamed protein product [Acanthoscelides obtectus]|nr:unnamed protein product [Acanthoscelides obtectus]CAK1639427.1 Lactase-phlorizin hydrolase [Acanthoscelides obtectus]
MTHTRPEMIIDGSNGDVASDSYHKYKNDVAIMKKVGVHFYRFSIAWSRILPDGTLANINQKGIDYYMNLLQELHRNGIEPMVTLYHWDLPTALQNQGGWMNNNIVGWFTDYARLCFQLFGPLVKHWATINEPKQICHAGYGIGIGAPGIRSAGLGEYLCAKYVLIAHASAYHVYDKEFRPSQQGKITIVLDSDWYEPGTPADEAAAEVRRQFVYGMYANPIIYGNWPQVMIDRVAMRSQMEHFNRSRLPEFSPVQQRMLKGTFDYLSINHYTTYMVSAIPERPPSHASWDLDAGVRLWQKPEWETAAIDWFKVVPWGFHKLLRWMKTTYGDHEIYVTENGVSDRTGVLDDFDRISYYRRYMSHMLDCINEGIRIIGYTAWSIIDNYEWNMGYVAHSGMYYINMTDPARPRIPKKSSYYYNHIIQTRCLLSQCDE